MLASSAMRAALVRPAAAAPGAVRVPSAGTAASAVLAAILPAALAVSALILLAALFFGGGADDDRLFWHGVAAVLAAAAAMAACALGYLARPRLAFPEIAATGLLTASVVWSGASVVWSIEPD